MKLSLLLPIFILFSFTSCQEKRHEAPVAGKEQTAVANEDARIREFYESHLIPYEKTLPQYVAGRALSKSYLPQMREVNERELAASDIHLIPLQTKVKDQGSRGQCHNFSVTAAFEFIYKQRENVSYDFSEQCNAWKFYKECGENCNGDPSDYGNDGGHISTEITFIKDKFMKYEDDYSYSSWLFPKRCDKEYNEAPYKTFSNVSTSRLAISRQFIKDAIARNAVVVIGTYWKSDKTNGHGEFPYQDAYDWCTGDDRCGGHAVVIVGYDDNYYGPNQGGFIFKNSWSKDWGRERESTGKPSGYGVFPYPYFSKYVFTAVAVSN